MNPSSSPFTHDLHLLQHDLSVGEPRPWTTLSTLLQLRSIAIVFLICLAVLLSCCLVVLLVSAGVCLPNSQARKTSPPTGSRDDTSY